ncbi:MAG: zinc-binding dehydrogenase [Acidimicrobiia bacterium]
MSGGDTSMRAAVMRDHALHVEHVPAPVPGPGEVLVRTLACGICGSDLHYLKHLDQMSAFAERTGSAEHRRLSAARPVVMGHEFCAELVDHGPGTDKRLRTGARVSSMPVAITSDAIHAIGYSHHYPGGYGELMVLSERLLVPVPDALPTDLAALTEPMAVGRHAVEKANLGDDDVPLVIGCGPVGLAVIAWLRAKGAGPIVAADFSPARRALAEALGADEVIDPAAQSPYLRWQDLAWPPGSDRAHPLAAIVGPRPRPGVIFDCVGMPGVLNAMLEGAMRGTRIVVVGVCMHDDRIEPLLGISKELNIQFVLAYTAEEFADTMIALDDGRLQVEAIITDRVDIAGVPDAFERLASPDDHAKILVRPS